MATSHMTPRGSGYATVKSCFAAIYAGIVGATGFRGTAALPVFSFEEDPDTGIYSTAANVLDVAAGGTRVQGFSAVASDTSIPPTTPARVYRIAFTPSAVTANSVAYQTVTVTGLATTDTILAVNPPAQTGDTWSIVNAYVSAANTLTVGFAQIGAGTPTPTAANGVTTFYRVVAVRSAS